MSQPANNNKEQVIEQAVQKFVDAQLQGHKLNIDEFVKQYPDIEEQLRQKIQNLQKIDNLFACLMQADDSDYREAVIEHNLIGEKLGDFEILNLIGTGGMGAVFLAKQISLDREVALKVISDISGARAKSLERFKREAKVLAKISHPHIVSIYEVGEEGPYAYFAMEFVKGVSLDKILASIRNASSDAKASEVMRMCLEDKSGIYDKEYAKSRQKDGAEIDTDYIVGISKIIICIALALENAHSKGILHRDVKPSNILIDSNGTPKLVDFGLARAETQQTITVTGEFFGTPSYVSPEQIRKPDTVDCRSDVYSLAATYYECLTLHPPFEGNTVNETLTRVISREATPPKKYCPRLSTDFNTVLLHALEKSQEDRYLTAADFADDIENLLEFKPIKAKKPSITQRTYKTLRRNPLKVVAVGAFILVIIMGYFLFSSRIQQKNEAIARELYQLGSHKTSQGEFTEALMYLEKAIKVNPKFIGAYSLAGDCFRYLGQPQKAIEIYKQAIEIDPNNTDSYCNLGTTYRDLGRHDEAIEVFKQTIRINPNSTGAYYNLGITYRDLGHHDKAIEAFKQTVRINPNNTDAYCNLGTIYRDLGRRNEAIEAFKQMIRINPNDADAYCNLGTTYRDLGRHDEAIEAFKQAIRINPNNTDAYCNLGTTYRDFGRHNEAIEAFKQMIRINPNDADAYYSLGTTYRDLGRPLDAISAYSSAADICLKDKKIHEALGYYTKVTSIDPNCSLAFVGSADCYFKLENYNEAIRFYHRALKAIPYDKSLKSLPTNVNLAAMIYIKLGDCYVKIGELGQAEKFYLQAVESEPNYYIAYVVLAHHYWTNENRYQDAIHMYRKALAIEPRDLTVYFSLGMCHFGLKNYQEAIGNYKTFLEVSPNDSLALFFMGNSYQMLVQHNKAVECLQKAIAIEPNNVKTHNALGNSCWSLGHYSDALRSFESALDIDAHNPETLCNLAVVFSQCPQDNLRNGPKAVGLAEKACELTNYENHLFITHLAAAYAECGDFEKAIEYQRKAIELADDETKEEYKKRLDAYKAHKPWRE